MAGFKNPKCYAAALGGCSSKISGEHYISESLLELLSDRPGFSISGLPWQKPNTPPPSIKSLTAKILCTNHNSELSKLDGDFLAFPRFFDDAVAAMRDLNRSVELVTSIQGATIERWILKALIGIVASGNSMKDGRTLPKSQPPLGWVQMLWGLATFPPTWGVYMLNPVGSRVMQARQLGLAPIVDGTVIKGAMFEIHGLRFLLAMADHAPDTRGTLLENARFRPGGFRISRTAPALAAQIHFAWGSGYLGDTVEISA